MEPQAIDLKIPNIKGELNRLGEPTQKDRSTKACLFTLILYASEQRRIKYLQELVASILDKFPCRIIFIHGNKESTSSYFRVNVSNVTSGQNKFSLHSQVKCDQIVIEASQDQLFRVPFLIFPNMVPDLPVYLLWGQNPFEERDVFPYIQNYARRIIFDSECADNLGLFCKEMQTNLDKLKMDLMDINWALVSNWRDLIAELFNTPDKLEHLKACKSMIIHYNDSKSEITQYPEVRALYLQGWIAEALKWKYQHVEKFENNTVISYFASLHPAIVALSPQNLPHLPPGAISSIEITTSSNHHYHLSRKDNLQQVSVQVSSNETCELPFTLSLPNIHKGLSFMREIFFNSLGNHYRETLKVISKIDFKTFTKEK